MINKYIEQYHWVLDDCKKINNIRSISQILENLDFSFDFLLLNRLLQHKNNTQALLH